MPDRSVRVVLSAKVDQYVAAMAKAAEATNKVDAASKSVQDWQATSTALLAVGTAAAAGLGMAAKAAIDWESQFAGVRKTVDGTTGQIAELEGQLRSMAASMPATHQELAATAEAAGQLGVARDDVAAFTEVMVQLGETTNLTSDEAATSLAQMMNIMGTAPDAVDRLGATLVALGNNGASTERDILALSHRLAGAGKQMGLTEADVMGIANAMASVGIEAEAGGTAMSETLKQMDAAVRQGGQGLETYARTAGMTAAEFARAWRDDPAQALEAFIAGLSRMSAEGGDVNAMLSDLGMEGVRQTDTLIRLAGAGDLLGESLDTAGQAYEQNSALATEYGKRVETTQAQLEIAANSIRDAAISVGESVLPVVADTAKGVADLAQGFAALPDPVLQAVAQLGGLIAAGGLVAGAGMKAVTAWAQFRTQLDLLGPSAKTTVGTLGRLGAAAGAFAAGLTVVQGIGSAIQSGMDDALLTEAQVRQAVDTMARYGHQSTAMMDAFGTAMAGTGGLTKDFAGAVEMLATDNGFLRWLESTIMGLAGMKGNGQMAEEEFDKLDKTLASMDAGKAGRAFATMADEVRKSGGSMDELVNQFDDYRASLLASADALGVHNLGEMEMRAWMEGTVPAAVAAAQAEAELGRAHVDAGASAEEQAAALQGLIDSMHEQADAALAASNADIAYQQSLADAAAVAAEGGAAVDALTGRFDTSTEAGRRAQGALDDVAAATWRKIDAMQADGATTQEVTGYTETARQQFIDTATAMGMTGDQAAALADKYGLIPAQVVTDVSAPGATDSTWQADNLRAALSKLPPEVRTYVESVFNDQGVSAAWSALLSIDGKSVNTYVNTYYRNYAESQGAVGPGSTRGGVTIATGGLVTGPGTGTSDSIPAWLSNGEFVIRAAAAEMIGYDRLAWMNRTGQLPRFAAGGRVSRDFTRSVGAQAPASHATSGPVVQLSAVMETPVDRDAGVFGRRVGEAMVPHLQRALSWTS